MSESFLLTLMRRHRKRDRKSTRLNSSHGYISYAVFCLKKKKRMHDDGAMQAERLAERRRARQGSESVESGDHIEGPGLLYFAFPLAAVPAVAPEVRLPA